MNALKNAKGENGLRITGFPFAIDTKSLVIPQKGQLRFVIRLKRQVKSNLKKKSGDISSRIATDKTPVKRIRCNL